MKKAEYAARLAAIVNEEVAEFNAGMQNGEEPGTYVDVPPLPADATLIQSLNKLAYLGWDVESAVALLPLAACDDWSYADHNEFLLGFSPSEFST